MGLREAITEQSKWGKTWNDADALKTTGSPLLDILAEQVPCVDVQLLKRS